MAVLRVALAALLAMGTMTSGVSSEDTAITPGSLQVRSWEEVVSAIGFQWVGTLYSLLSTLYQKRDGSRDGGPLAAWREGSDNDDRPHFP